MASGSGNGYEKILAARKTKVQIDHLKFEISQRDLRVNKLKQELTNLRIENEKLRKLLGK